MGCAKFSTQSGGGVAVRVGSRVGVSVMARVGLGVDDGAGAVGLGERVRMGAAVLVAIGVCEALSSSACAVGAWGLRLNQMATPAEIKISPIRP